MPDDPIDRAVLAELQEATGAEFANELIATFLEEAPGMFTELRQAADAGDADGFRRAAHSIKSNASTFGAHLLANLARDLELQGLPADPGPPLAALDAAQAAAADALKAVSNG